MNKIDDKIMFIDLYEMKAMLSYDPSTGVFRWRIKPCRNIRAGDIAGGPTENGYIHIRIRGVAALAHRLAWYYFYEERPPYLIDHIDGNRSNNAIGNLREATIEQNAANHKYLSPLNTTGFRGVQRARPRRGNGIPEKPWWAKIFFRGKLHFLGSFHTKEEALAAYEAAALKFWGKHYTRPSAQTTDLVTPPALMSSVSQIRIE